MEAHCAYTYNADVMAPGYAVAHKVVMAGLWNIVRVFGFVAIGAGIATIAGSSRGVGVLLILVGLWLLLVPRLVSWFTARSLRSNPRYGQDIEWTVTSAGLTLSSDGVDSPMSWGSFSQVVDTNKGVLLVRPGTFYWLPADRFLEPDGQEIVADLAELSGTKFSRKSV